GVKGDVGVGASYQIAGYRARVEEALVPFQDPDAPGRQFFRNAGSAVHEGVEASVVLSPLRGLSARLAYTVTDARFERYVVGDVVYDGNRVPGLAPVRFDAALSYRSPAGWFAGVDYRRRSRTPVDDGNTAYSPGHHVTDVRLGVEGLRIGAFEASPFAGVTNLFDAEYDAAVTVNAFGGRYYEPAPGRAGGVRGRVGRRGRPGRGRAADQRATARRSDRRRRPARDVAPGDPGLYRLTSRAPPTRGGANRASASVATRSTSAPARGGSRPRS